MKKIFAIGIIAILVCSVGLVIAQNQSEDVVASTSLSAVGEKNYTYDGKNDSKNITKLRQEIEAQMEKLDDRELDLIKGTYDRPPGVKDYEPPKVPMPKPTPPTGLMKISPSSTPAEVEPASPDVAAGYQIFGRWKWWMSDKSYLGRVWCRTESVQDLKNYAKEWHVMHQDETNGWQTTAENAIVLMRQDDTAICAPFFSSLGGYQTDDYKYYPANHVISIGIRPEHSYGSREYNEIYIWIWDRTDDIFWGKTYNLPQTEEITVVDAALECDENEAPNSLWKNFYKFSPLNEYIQSVNLPDEFTWFERSSPVFNNEHAEEYYIPYTCYECSCGDPYFCYMYPDDCYWYEVPCEGPLSAATLWQRKTPK